MTHKDIPWTHQNPFPVSSEVLFVSHPPLQGLLFACSLDRMTASSASSGMASRPHLGILFTVPSSSGAHRPLGRPFSRPGHSAELWTQCQSRVRPTTASSYAFPSLSGYCCPCHIIPLSMRHYFFLVHCPGVSTLTPVTTYHGPRFPGKVGPKH